MDENTNDSNKQPDLIRPGSEQETSETTSASETPSTESNSGTATSAPDVPDSNTSVTPKANQSEGIGASEEPAPTPTVTPTEPSSSAPHETTAAPGATPSTSVIPAKPESSETTTPASTPVAPGVVGTPPAPSLPDDELAPTPNAKPIVPGQPEKKKMMKIVGIVVIVVIVAIIAIAVAVSMGSKKKTVTTTATTASTASTVKINTWTGKADTYDWDTAANWSLGIPVNGESLVFNVSTINQPSGSAIVGFTDNIPNLTVNKFMIEGQGKGFEVKGDPITITNGISDDITLASKATTAPGVSIDNAVTFTGNQAIQAGASNDLSFNGASTASTITTIGTSTVQFVAAKSSDIEIFTPIVGSGILAVPASTTTTGNVDFNTASPNFTGNVMINKGATMGLGNQNPGGSGTNDMDAFGNSTITIASGAYLELNEVGSTAFTVSNPITVSGTGGASASQVNGAYTGAVTTCITKAQQGCSDGATVTFTGKVTLAGDAQFGAFYGSAAPQAAPSTTVTYVLKDLVTNSHTLTAVAKSKAVIQTQTTAK
jgi:hypothetical protein